ncbi:MAG TPA: glycosyltransferase family 4 protein, partial [Verrucomicrobiae bacterium]|nr:glycosyltransferase family 4 protein [Verrucomicrobiae bacterium]
RYASMRNVKYVFYPFFLERLVLEAARTTKFDLLLSQHTISAVAAGRLRNKLGVPVAMNFLDFLTGFMETWPRYVMPKPVLKRLEKFELSLPSKYEAEAVLTVSDVLANLFAEAGYPKKRLKPIFYGYDSTLFPLRDFSRVAPASAPVVVMHGSFDQHHLGAIARNAIIKVAAQKPATTFRFVGKETPGLKNFVAAVKREVPNAKLECTGFLDYKQVAARLSDATVGIIPYEESIGTHCAFVAKLVEYLGIGLPVVSTPLRNVMSYFKDEPMIRFAGFDGDSFAREILKTFEQPVEQIAANARAVSQRVQRELDWRAISRNAVEFLEAVHRQKH